MKCILTIFILVITLNSGIAQIPKEAETVSVHGTTLYYEAYGQGEPLFLLHGYFGSTIHWESWVADFSDDYKVYLVDLPGHGKSDPFKKEFSIRKIAGDFIALVEYLDLEKINGIGFSYGGDVLFHAASLQPGLIQNMISIGALGSWDINDFPDWIEHFSYKNLDQLEWIKKYQGDDNIQIRALFDRFREYTFRMSDQDLKNIRARTLLVVGDDDYTLTFDQMARARKQLPESDLWMPPHSGHNAHEQNKEEFIRITREFLKGGEEKESSATN